MIPPEFIVLGIDPGPSESAFCLATMDYRIHKAEKVSTSALLEWLKSHPADHVAIESIQSYGMIVGREVFDTCYAIGRLIQVCEDVGIPYTLYPRQEYLRRICGGSQTKDSTLRQALELRFGGYGETVYDEEIPAGEEGAGVYKGGPRKGQARRRTVRVPQPLRALNCTDKRSAYGLAVYHIDGINFGRKEMPHASRPEAMCQV